MQDLLTPAKFAEYQTSRREGARWALCHAPFSSLNFERNGKVTACSSNREQVLGIYPRDSIASIWQGPEARKLRDSMRDFEAPPGCRLCTAQIASRYDAFVGGSPGSWPLHMVFELSNLASPYGQEFVRELEAFIPHLTSATFQGGEPFLNSLYFEIWGRIIDLNPSLTVSIVSNGTVLTPEIRSLLKTLDAEIILSVDTLDREHDEPMRENLEFFRTYSLMRGRYLKLAAQTPVEPKPLAPRVV